MSGSGGGGGGSSFARAGFGSVFDGESITQNEWNANPLERPRSNKQCRMPTTC